MGKCKGILLNEKGEKYTKVNGEKVHIDGKGMYIFKSGGYYKGTWINNTINGTGKYVNGEFYYFGEFKNQSYHGDGIWMNNRSGEKYVGKFENSKRYGFGTLSTEHFDVEGLFSNGKFINGKVINKIDGLISEGEFNGYMRFLKGTIIITIQAQLQMETQQ